jgi:hypothetical protein
VDGRAGTYTDGVDSLKITVDQGRLVVSQSGRTHRMRPLDPTTYVDDDDPDVVLQFHDGEPDPVCTLRYPLWWFTGYRTRHLPASPPRPADDHG